MMRRLGMIIALASLAACGKVKNLDPLNGLAGPEDNTRYGFESSAMGWAPSAYLGGTCQSVFQNPGQSFWGQGSLALRTLNTDNTNNGANSAAASIIFGSPQNLTGKTIRLWLYAPLDIAPSDDKPSYVSIFTKSNTYANGMASNIARGNWTEVVFAPQANSTAVTVTAGGAFIPPTYDPSSVTELGVKVGIAGTASGFSFTGTILLDGVDW